MTRTLLKVLGGSQAYGLAGPDSDYDYYGVFALATTTLLRIEEEKFEVPRQSFQTWEVEHFLRLSLKSNPTILGIYRSPLMECDAEFGAALRDLFGYVWSSDLVYVSFLEYAKSQIRQWALVSERERNKSAYTYLRILYQGCILLQEHQLPINMQNAEIFKTLQAIKAGKVSLADIRVQGNYWEEKLALAYTKTSQKRANLIPINDFLLDLRRKNWHE